MADTNDNTPQTEQAAPRRGWVWYSSDASIAAGQISVLAVAEVFAAVGLFWWLSSHFEWPWYSMIGLMAAPILLLRSEASVELGVETLRHWIKRSESNISRWEKRIAHLCATAVSGLLVYVLALSWLSGHTGGPLYWRSAILGMIGVASALTVIVAFMAAATNIVSVAFIGATVAAAVVWYMDVGWVAIVFAVTAVPLSALMFAISGEGYIGKVAEFALYFWYAAAYALGALLRSFVIRILATLRCFIDGLRQLPRNWRENLAVIDLCHLPELMPRASEVGIDFALNGLWRHWANQNWKEKIFAIIVSPIWYVPALSYRWSLKASAWLWWPLALALTPPFQGLDASASRERAAHLTQGAWAFSALMPLAVLAWLLASAWPGLMPWLALQPDLETSATKLLQLLTPPALGLRYVMLWSSALLALALWWQRKNLAAAWGTVLESDNELRELTDEARSRFQAHAAGVERIRLWLIVSLFFLGEAVALAFAHSKSPQYVESHVWPWLLAWL